MAGTCASNLYGLCESFFKPDMVRACVRGRLTTDQSAAPVDLHIYYIHILLPLPPL